MVYSNKHSTFTDWDYSRTTASGLDRRCVRCTKIKPFEQFAPRSFIGSQERSKICYECKDANKARKTLFRDENGRVRSMYHYGLACGHQQMFKFRADDEQLYCYQHNDWSKVVSHWRGPSSQTEPPERSPEGITRRCSSCEQDLPLSEYYKSTSNRYRACRTCYRAKENAQYDKMPTEVRERMLERKRAQATKRRRAKKEAK